MIERERRESSKNILSRWILFFFRFLTFVSRKKMCFWFNDRRRTQNVNVFFREFEFFEVSVSAKLAFQAEFSRIFYGFNSSEISSRQQNTLSQRVKLSTWEADTNNTRVSCAQMNLLSILKSFDFLFFSRHWWRWVFLLFQRLDSLERRYREEEATTRKEKHQKTEFFWRNYFSSLVYRPVRLNINSILWADS